MLDNCWQASCTPVLLSTDGTDRRMDGHPTVTQILGSVKNKTDCRQTVSIVEKFMKQAELIRYRRERLYDEWNAENQMTTDWYEAHTEMDSRYNKSVLATYLLSTWHCSHLLLSAVLRCHCCWTPGAVDWLLLPHGAQQQTHCTPQLQSNDVSQTQTDKGMDGSRSAYYVRSVNNSTLAITQIARWHHQQTSLC